MYKVSRDSLRIEIAELSSRNGRSDARDTPFRFPTRTRADETFSLRTDARSGVTESFRDVTSVSNEAKFSELRKRLAILSLPSRFTPCLQQSLRLVSPVVSVD